MLTRRGRKVRGFLIGALVGFTIWFINGFWWDCDLRAGATTPCRVIWQMPFVSAD
jgi:hypothetical protein